MQKPLIMRFLLPRQVTLAARRKKKFSLGREQMRNPQALFVEKMEKKNASEKSLQFARIPKNLQITVICNYQKKLPAKSIFLRISLCLLVNSSNFVVKISVKQ